MELTTLNVSKQQAKEAVAHYRKAVKEHRRAEDRAILRGYNAILKGRKLIELSKVIAAGGVDEHDRPRLAVIRADQRSCHMVRCPSGSVRFEDGPRRSRARACNVEFAAGTLPAGKWAEGQAVVPLVPPQHRPADDLANYFILWEAEWKDVPRDPALLKHLGGDLYAVVAVWDLSDLEMAVLSGRRR